MTYHPLSNGQEVVLFDSVSGGAGYSGRVVSRNFDRLFRDQGSHLLERIVAPAASVGAEKHMLELTGGVSNLMDQSDETTVYLMHT